MPVVRQKMIFRRELQAHPDVFFVFGDNVERKGYGGQAKEMRDEPNAIGVATKFRGGMNNADFFSDNQIEHILANYVIPDLDKVEKQLAAGKTVVIPADGLGTGLAMLPDVAPKINAYIVGRIRGFEHEYNDGNAAPDYVSRVPKHRRLQ